MKANRQVFAQDVLQQVKEAEATGQLLPKDNSLAINLHNYTIRLHDNGRYKSISPIDIAKEALEAERKQGQFSEHMFMLADRCSNPDEFDQVCEAICTAMLWGKAPAGTPENEVKLYSRAPEVYKVYRSTIYTAWKRHNLRVNVDYNNLNQLKVAVKQLRLQGPESDKVPPTTNAVGELRVLPKGKISLNTGSSQIEAGKLGVLMSRLVKAYNALDGTAKMKLLTRFERVVLDFEQQATNN